MVTWRHFTGSESDALLTVCTYQTRAGKPMDPKHSRMVRIDHVTKDEAVRMLRQS